MQHGSRFKKNKKTFELQQSFNSDVLFACHFSHFIAADSHLTRIGAPATLCKITLSTRETGVATLAVVRLTSCKQAELDAALGQMTVKAQACSEASVMAQRRQFNKKSNVFAAV